MELGSRPSIQNDGLHEVRPCQPHSARSREEVSVVSALGVGLVSELIGARIGALPLGMVSELLAQPHLAWSGSLHVPVRLSGIGSRQIHLSPGGGEVRPRCNLIHQHVGTISA
jgi:hypothetical protein